MPPSIVTEYPALAEDPACLSLGHRKIRLTSTLASSLHKVVDYRECPLGKTGNVFLGKYAAVRAYEAQCPFSCGRQ